MISGVSEIKVFVHPALDEERKENVSLRRLIEDFKAHKQGVLIHYFGREARYDRPSTVASSEILHIHILHESSRAFKAQAAAIKRGSPRDPFGLRCDMDRPEHDKALIYTRGAVKRDYYCVLDFFSGRAHELARSIEIMNELVERAEKFRSYY